MSKNRHARRPGEILDLPKSMRLPVSEPVTPVEPLAPPVAPATGVPVMTAPAPDAETPSVPASPDVSAPLSDQQVPLANPEAPDTESASDTTTPSPGSSPSTEEATPEARAGRPHNPCPRCGQRDNVMPSGWENRLPDPVTINGRFFAHGLVLRGCHCRTCDARYIDRQPGTPAG